MTLLQLVLPLSFQFLPSTYFLFQRQQRNVSLAREILYQLDVFASKIPLQGFFQGNNGLLGNRLIAITPVKIKASVLYALDMKLYSLKSGVDNDVTGIAVDGSSIVLPRNELLASIGHSSGEYCI